MSIAEKLVLRFVFFSFILAIGTVGGTILLDLPFMASGFSAVARLAPLAATKVAATSTGNVETKPVIEEILLEPKELLPAGDYIRPFTEAKNTLLSSDRDFAEIDFSDMAIKHYRGEELVSSTTIAKAGDPQGWGGTPAGLYTIQAKNERSFSASAEAFMPLALHFYGKYFIHGEPYYPSGRKVNSTVSGGCVQVADEYATRVYETLAPDMPLLVIDKPYDEFVYRARREAAKPAVSAQGFLVADLDSGQVLVEKNSTTKFSIASVTKLMTATVVAEHIDLRRDMEITDDMVETGFGETENLLAGASFRVVELFYPLLIESSNDAAEAVAGFLGRNRTITLMNEKAEHLFMADTTFDDPSGIGDKNVSTARDLYLLGRYLRNNRRPILDITRGEKVTSFGPVRFSLSALENKNEFAADRDFIGGKSGYLDIAKNTGLFLFKIKAGGAEREVAVVVLKSEHLKKDAAALKEWVEREYW